MVIVMERDSEPLVPVTVSVYAPIGVLCNALTLSIEVPCPPDVKVTDEVLSDVFGPDVGETTVERFMVPANPFILVRDIVDPAEEPLEMVIADGPAVIPKSPPLGVGLLTVTGVCWDNEPLVPTFVTA